MKRGLQSPGSPDQALRSHGANSPNLSGSIWEPRYDYQVKTAAATNIQRFFVDPVGKDGKTKSSTNMTLSSQMPAGQRFLITGIHVELFPGAPITSAAAGDYADDILAFYQTGYLRMEIGSKDFMTQAPLAKFPPANTFEMDFATGAVEQYSNARVVGQHMQITPVTLVANQNFSVELHEMPALSAEAKLGVTLAGYLWRNAQ